jgi:hypothetical protein
MSVEICTACHTTANVANGCAQWACPTCTLWTTTTQERKCGMCGGTETHRTLGEFKPGAPFAVPQDACPDCGTRLERPECEARYCAACYWCEDHGSACDDAMAHVKGEH